MPRPLWTLHTRLYNVRGFQLEATEKQEEKGEGEEEEEVVVVGEFVILDFQRILI